MSTLRAAAIAILSAIVGFVVALIVGASAYAQASEPCDGFVVSGVAGEKLTYADHELGDGTFWVGEIAITFKHRGATGLMRIPELRGKTVRLMLQEVPPASLETIRR